eukprot:TRINITY_DN1826_c0_g1_i1.p1 TRINITY_DN1826_c0_g1~~TRINITY_DN1826_c0_g1_i1.p1  ORF type:complete len:308 (+),score=57.93 TRINITY_DN1826_c0_g1_i1:163-1086(+)
MVGEHTVREELEYRPRALGIVEAFLEPNGTVRNYDGQYQWVISDQPWQWLLPLLGCLFYAWMVFILPKSIKSEVTGLKGVLAAWNLFLSVGSGILLFFWVSTQIPEFINGGFSFHHLICNPHRELDYGLNMICATVFAFSKFFELIDTLFLVLRRRPVAFLHWYHHITVLPYTWYAVLCAAPAGNIFGIMNAFVHTIMYFYYFLAAIGPLPSWGAWVTRIQIAQMIGGLATSSAWIYWHYADPETCHIIRADGIPYSDRAFIISTVLLYAGYLYLFVALYFEKKRQRASRRAAGGASSRTSEEKKRD